MSDELILVSKDQLITSISDFNDPLTSYLTRLNLPIQGVLYPINERKKIINALEEALDILPIEEREKAVYLTRFTASVIAGLFDGAITYLWNETIKSLRKMVANFDLEFFYKISESINSRYKGLMSFEDLSIVSEYDLLTVCNRMGLITDHVFEIFKFINYMRNHSSAAHPNENSINAYDILSWLENCIQYAINATPNHSAIKLKQLLHNIRKEDIPINDAGIIGESIANLPQQMVDDLLWTLFGLYTDPKTISGTTKNITLISKFVWNASSDDKKYEVGEKYGYFRKNADIQRKERADEFLKNVGGTKYKDEDSIAYEIRDKLNSLRSAHFSMNNFYNEYPWAKMLQELIPESGIIPDSVLKEWVKVITICYIGNGLGYRDGIDESAAYYYNEYINSFGDREINELLNLMNDQELLSDIHISKPERRFKSLCRILHEKTNNIFLKNCLKFIIDFSSSLDKVYMVTEYKNKLQLINL
ncbi:hypothetical protein [Clostridium manihotivorum]|uniref:Uncharacterized protein n=1 Tax=Clostridium manihotivorum TaxID=2320868 RepID=A0A410DMQ6_9CLOT|nr:hypothetical protein [Clostridium manihotivorum]QAA30353.1 hypothetical protein C1I91_00890 [Clostridium manihotivorum]